MANEVKTADELAPGEFRVPSNYRELSIENAGGNILSSGNWTISKRFTSSVGRDELGRTTIATSESKPAYIVNNGTDSDFAALTRGSGVYVGNANSLRMHSSFLNSSELKVLIVIIEFDGELNRIGDVTLEPNSGNLVKLTKDTKYVLPSIRLAGRGDIVLNWFHLDAFNATSLEEMPRSRKIELLTIGDPADIASIQGGFEEAQNQLAALSDAILRLQKHTSIPLRESGANSQRKVATDSTSTHLNSRADGDISTYRESLSRELLLSMAASLPESRGSKHYRKIPFTLGIITDEYMFNFYKDVFEKVVYFTPSNFAQRLQEEPVDIVMYVTCWKGVNGEEWKGIKYREQPMAALTGILEWAKDHSVPTVFQSIEDPSNFEYFLPIAEKFDYVFTSDSEVISHYKDALGHDRVFYGEYGANPIVNNPIGTWRFNLNRALFAGSYPERYPERTRDMEIIFDSIPNRRENLLILDRNFDTTGYEFPERYQENILGPVNHAALQKLHKMFRYSLNFNSIKSSPTMCAMRVYELQAQGLPIISNYARSVFNKFPAIRIVPEVTQISEFENEETDFRELKTANELMIDLQLYKNSFEIVSIICNQVGLSNVESNSRSVLLLAEGDEKSISNFVSLQKHPDIRIAQSTDEFRLLKQSGDFAYVGAVDCALDYEATYLTSRLAAFVYTESEFVTQKAFFAAGHFQEGPVHEFTDGATNRFVTLLSADVDDAEAFVTGELGRIQGNGYAVDPFGIGYRRFERDRLEDESQEEKKLSIIVPVYNNGEFLVNKCIESIRRNASWLSFQILLIDDGSNDGVTQKICEDLAWQYSNIKYFTFNDGGSGSASRPRNKGVEIATTELVSFLDPDNEISTGAYDALLEQYANLDANGIKTDFVSGYQVKVGESLLRTGKHAGEEPVVIQDTDLQFFGRGKFPVISTQASVIRRSLLEDNNIHFIEGAAGQDTLYGWEVLHYAENPTFVSNAYIVYYAERDGSVTNNFGLGYFEKCLVLEKAQVESLRKMGQLEKFRDGHFDNFMRNWYIKRFEQVESEKDEIKQVLSQIIELYGQDPAEYLVKA